MATRKRTAAQRWRECEPDARERLMEQLRVKASQIGNNLAEGLYDDMPTAHYDASVDAAACEAAAELLREAAPAPKAKRRKGARK